MATREITQEQLQHFLDNPEEVDATDTELIEALAKAELAAAGEKVGDGEIEKVEDPDAEAAREAKAEADAKIAAVKAAEEAKADPEGGDKEESTKILTPDGKHTLPFSVLKETRARAQGAEEALAEAQQQIVALSERVKAMDAGKPDPGAGDQAKTPDELEAMLEAVGEEAPWLKDAMGKLVSTVRTLSDRVAQYDEEREENEEAAVARLKGAAQTAEENNPTLTLWKEQAPALYAEAASFDKAVRANPTQNARFKTFDQRFDHVVELVKASHRGEEIPLPKAVASTPAKETPKPSAADVKKRAEAALASAGEEPVRTLTDIPGGEGEQTPQEALERMDHMAIAEAFGRKSPQQILEWVQGGGARL